MVRNGTTIAANVIAVVGGGGISVDVVVVVAVVVDVVVVAVAEDVIDQRVANIGDRGNFVRHAVGQEQTTNGVYNRKSTEEITNPIINHGALVNCGR
jgi:hypothetical protein